MDDTISIDAFATMLGVSTKTLQRWRNRGIGPTYVRLTGGGPVHYSLGEAEAWLERHKAVGTISNVALAKKLGVKPVTLWRWRKAGIGPKCIRLEGSGYVRYSIADVDEWLESRTVRGVN
jgi:predicted DNA-binding transcriptional regulator AlpA